MNNKLKKVFSINLEPGYRNYTVKNLIDIKGKKKLTQIFVNSPEEAAAAEDANIDLILTRPSTELRKIREAAPKTFLTVSIPFLDHSSKDEIIKKAFEIVALGADSIHCGSWNLNFMKYLNEFKIPFQGHAGLVPRKSTWTGGVRAYGKNANEAMQLLNDVKKIEETGAWAVEIECVPKDILAEITKQTNMLTISIGSGSEGDGQFLFADDILGYSSIDLPRHAKSYRDFIKIYGEVQKERVDAFVEFKKEVLSNKFPSENHSIKIDKKELLLFKKLLNKNRK